MARLRVNPIACEAHGLCAELFPEWIALDDWGYPMSTIGRSRPICSTTPVARPMPARRSPSCSIRSLPGLLSASGAFATHRLVLGEASGRSRSGPSGDGGRRLARGRRCGCARSRLQRGQLARLISSRLATCSCPDAHPMGPRSNDGALTTAGPAGPQGNTVSPVSESVTVMATEGQALAASRISSSGPSPITIAMSSSSKTSGAMSTQSPWALHGSVVDGGDVSHWTVSLSLDVGCLMGKLDLAAKRGASGAVDRSERRDRLPIAGRRPP